ncbi:hypothetical protein B0H13DRAFT_2371295 [Mycena leptocephala]|nr:hypothetical protein B0H13DRAFT_2371295 [Mycena leptocephala]
MTQKLFTPRGLRRWQSLSATHDSAASWSGIGSALAGLFAQRNLPSSVVGVLSTFIYLSGILALHTTTPALFAVEAFNPTQLVHAPTQDLPILSGVNVSDPCDILRGITAGTAMFPMLLYMDSLSTVRLHGSTLYDVLSSSNGTGVASVNAYTFQIACGYVTDVTSRNFVWNETLQAWSVTTDGSNYTLIPLRWTGAEDVGFYSTAPILDTNGATGPILNLSFPAAVATASIISIQLFRCTHTLANLNAVVNVPSWELVSLGKASPSSESARRWLPFTAFRPYVGRSPSTPLRANDLLKDRETLTTPEGFIDAWTIFYLFGPISNYQSSSATGAFFFPFTDLFLTLDLGLVSASTSVPTPTSVTLLEVDASLARLLASMYWILGHIQLTFGFQTDDQTGTIVTNLTSLVEGRATITEQFVRARLDLSIVAVAGGLAASIILLAVSVQFLQFREWGRTKGAAHIDGTSLLHTIWLYRRHPAL